MSDNLQTIVDEMRADLAAGRGGFWCLRSDKLPAPLYIEVIPDGARWIVMAECGGESVFDTKDSGAVEPEEFLSNLYVFVRRLMKAITAPPKLS